MAPAQLKRNKLRLELGFRNKLFSLIVGVCQKPPPQPRFAGPSALPRYHARIEEGSAMGAETLKDMSGDSASRVSMDPSPRSWIEIKVSHPNSPYSWRLEFILPAKQMTKQHRHPNG